MPTYIAFLRAVNVGGRSVPMAALRGHLAEAGFTDVETYIQSGNVRVGSRARSTATVERKLEQAMTAALDLEIPAIVRTPRELVSLVESAPESPLGDEARHYVAFLRGKPSASAAKEINGWHVNGERLALVGRDVHMWLTKPSHEAKASNARLEKITGTASTNRGWKVVTALAQKWG